MVQGVAYCSYWWDYRVFLGSIGEADVFGIAFGLGIFAGLKLVDWELSAKVQVLSIRRFVQRCF